MQGRGFLPLKLVSSMNKLKQLTVLQAQILLQFRLSKFVMVQKQTNTQQNVAFHLRQLRILTLTLILSLSLLQYLSPHLNRTLHLALLNLTL